jgi:type I restriction enzyme, S subunit
MASEWREIRLGDLVAQGALSISDGYRVRNEELGPQGIPFVRGGDIRDGWINTTTVDHIRPELADRVRAKLAHPGDIAFITKGTVGRAGRLRPGQPAIVFAPQVAYWRVLAPAVLDSRFLFYLIRSYAFQSALDGVKTHGSMVADYVSISLQQDFTFDFPDIGSQRAIAHILGALDDKIELNRRINETLEAMARALFKSWFVDFDPVRAKADGRDSGLPKPLADLFPDSFEDAGLEAIPSGWRMGEIADLVSVLRDQLNPLEAPDELFSHFSIPAFDDAQRPKAEHGQDIKSLKFIVPPGVILLSKLNPEIERVWLVDTTRGKQSICSTEFLVLRPKAPFTRGYVYCMLRSPAFRRGIESLVTGTSKSHQRAHAATVLGLGAIMPPTTIIASFDRATKSLLERTLVCRREATTLAALRDTLLPKLISGELRLKDAEKLVGSAA